MCIYVYVYICIYVYLYIRMYIYIYVCMYICIYVYMYICIYVYMYICVYVYMYICIYVYMYICVCVYIYKLYYIIYILYILYIYIYQIIFPFPQHGLVSKWAVSKPLLNGDSGELSSPNLPDEYIYIHINIYIHIYIYTYIYIHRGLSSLYYRYQRLSGQRLWRSCCWRLASPSKINRSPCRTTSHPHRMSWTWVRWRGKAVTGWLLKSYNWIRRGYVMICNVYKDHR